MATTRDRSGAAARGVAGAAFRAFLNSLSIQIAVLGAVFVLIGYVLGSGVMAALFPIWGAGLLVVGVFSYAVVWRTRR